MTPTKHVLITSGAIIMLGIVLVIVIEHAFERWEEIQSSRFEREIREYLGKHEKFREFLEKREES